jgi:Holliday junction resolvasome RuvABC endonuclease subunit
MRSNDMVLALDLSSRVGWAAGRVCEDRPRSGVWVLPGPSDLGRTYAAFENELLDAITVHQPALLVLEAAIPGGHLQTNHNVAQQQIGLAAMAEAACYRREVRLVKTAASTMRKEVIGTGRFPSGQAKKIIMGWLRERGFSFVDDNSADATVAWLWAKKEWGRI